MVRKYSWLDAGFLGMVVVTCVLLYIAGTWIWQSAYESGRQDNWSRAQELKTQHPPNSAAETTPDRIGPAFLDEQVKLAGP